VPARRWILLPLAALAVGLLIAAQGAPRGGGDGDAPVEPLGLPGVREYHALVVDGRDPKVMLLGTERGVFRTRDGGVRWLLAGLDGRAVAALAQRGAGYVAAGPGYAAESDDRGVTWRVARIAGPHSTTTVVHPDNKELMLAFDRGLRSSTDGGRVWRDAGVDAAAAAWSPSEREVAYAAGVDGQLYVTRDAGETWQVAG
jgi:hypothetical protein